MWLDEYEALNSTDKNEFRRLCNGLLSRTYLLCNVYDDQKKMMDMNGDYRTARRLFPLMQQYFAMAGWDLYNDTDYGVMYISNRFDSNRVRFNRFTTLFLYMLRIIYEENREKVELYRDVRTDTRTVTDKMNVFGLLPKGKPKQKEYMDAQKALANYQVITKVDGAWKPEGNKLLIYPTILFLLPNSEINAMYRQLQALKKDETTEDESYEEDTAT